MLLLLELICLNRTIFFPNLNHFQMTNMKECGNMQENISETSGFVRLALGTGLTALGASHLTKENGNKVLGLSFLVAGAMKVAEGVFLYCPTKALINSNVKDAMSSTIEEFMDGETLMSAFGSLYQNANKSGSTSQSSSSSSSSSSSQNLAQTVSNIAKTVSQATPSGTAINTAAKAAENITTSTNNQSTTH